MKSLPSILFALLRAAIGIGVLFYLGFSGAIDWSALLGLVSKWPITLVALILLFVDTGFMALRLSVLFWPLGLNLPFNSSLRLTLVGIFFNSFLPGATGGDLVRILYATQGNRGRRAEVATVILLDRAVGMFGLLVLPLLLAPLFFSTVSSMPILRNLLLGAAVAALAMLASILICFSRRLRKSWLLSWMFQKLPGGGYARRIFDTVHGYRHNVAALGGALGISLITHMLTTGVTLLAVSTIHPKAVAWEMCMLIPLGHVANALPLTPGGLGVGEAAFNVLFAAAGLKGGADALLGWRLLMILLGLPGLLFCLQGRRRFFLATAEVSAPLDSRL